MSSEHSVLHPPTDRPFACSLSFTLFLHHPIRRYEICAIAQNRKREMHVPWLYDYPATQHDNVPPLIRFVFFLYFFVCLLHLSRCSLLLSFVDHLHAWNARVCCVYVCGLWYIIIIFFISLLCFWLVLSVQLFCCSSSSSSRNGYTTQQQLPRL